jgi:RHS repeat-associated protein
VIRYQYGNHLGSSSLELDHEAQVISYEEYFPYGSTSYQAVRPNVEVARKRYRYTGMERDEESGLYYHGARYYAPWLGRWTSCDPAATLADRGDPSAERPGIPRAIDTNVYAYVRTNPVRFVDRLGYQESESDEEDSWLNRARVVFNQWASRERHRLEVIASQLPSVAEQAAEHIDQLNRFLNGPSEVESRIYSPEVEAEIIERSRTVEDLGQADVDLDPIVPVTERGPVMQSGAGGQWRAAALAASQRAATLARGTGRAVRELDAASARFQSLNPTVVLETLEGPTLVARGPTRNLPVASRTLLREGEELVRMRPDILVPRQIRIHPDVRVLVRAHFEGVTPRVLAVHGRPFCASCVETIEAFGGRVIEPGVAIFR